MSLCEYKDIFGKVGEGIHSYRVMNIAIIDVVGTLVGAYFLQKYVFPQYDYTWVLVGLFILGIILHRIFCVKTTVDNILFN
jgi:hypothetical protein